jgi:hypothetical protein
MDRVDKTRYAVALVAVLAIIGLIMVMAQSDRTSKPMAINGDQLGMDSSESVDDYLARASASVANAGAPAYALVTFQRALSPQAAGFLLDQADLDRVGAALTDRYLPIALPEPTQGLGRADVLEQQLRNNGDPAHIEAVVVRDDGEALRALAQADGVFAVEALPADAAWGRFGIRPVFRG